MKALAIEEYGEPDKLHMMDLPEPEPGPEEIVIRIRAAGVNPVDYKIRKGWLKDRLPNFFPLIPGWDAAGTVARVGNQVTQFRVGDPVLAFCRKPTIQHGCYAERVAVPQSFAARKPEALSFYEAAALPLAGLTAYQSIFDAVGLKPGETVLIHAAAGGVGGFAVQLANGRGARAIGTAGPHHRDYVKALGADRVIDYTAEDFRVALRRIEPAGVDAVFDTVGGETLTRSPDILKPGGRLVSLLEPPVVNRLKEQGVDAHYVFVTPNGRELAWLAAEAAAGRLKINVTKILPLEQAAQAHLQLETRHTRGKIVLDVA